MAYYDLGPADAAETLLLTHGELESWSSSYVPTAQFVHDVCPAAEYVPAAQASHAVDESLSKSYSPAAHGVHAVDPAAAYCPTPHAVHGVLGPSVSAKPAAHCVHVAAPAAAYSPSFIARVCSCAVCPLESHRLASLCHMPHRIDPLTL